MLSVEWVTVHVPSSQSIAGATAGEPSVEVDDALEEYLDGRTRVVGAGSAIVRECRLVNEPYPNGQLSLGFDSCQRVVSDNQ